MPIQLASAFNPGDFDAGTSYAQLAIESFKLQAGSLELTMHYGNTVSGAWERGASSEQMNLTVIDPDLATLIASAPAIRTGSDPVPSEFYQWLIDNGHYSGTII